ncbi:MAG: winged helix-turn-helix domain-containing protein, partial [Bacteroidota bacterium]
MTTRAYRIGEWTVQPSLLKISKGEKVLKIEPQLMEVLNLLVVKSGQIVTKEELKNSIWSDVVVTENVFTRSISSLRKALEDDPSDPTYIETISKTGYRLMVPVKFLEQKPIDAFTLKLPRRPTVLIVAITVLLGLGAFVFLQTFNSPPPPLVYDPLAIVNSSASEYWPSISSDGRFVAYASNQDKGNWDIYIKSIGTEGVSRITDNKSAELRAVWSADDNYIYYLRYEEGGANIYKKPIIEGNEIRVAKAPANSKGDFDVSSNDKQILFNRRIDKQLPLEIVIISLETGDYEVLTNPDSSVNGDLNPRFSPDNQKIAFIREKNPASMFLYVKDLQSGVVSQVTTSPQSINGFDWTADGSHLVYGSDRSGLYKLWNVNIETRQSSVIRAGDYQMVMPRVAETGRHLYAKMKDNVNIWSYDIEGKQAKIWFSTNDLNLNPTFSPDGSKVCFTMKKNHSYELWVANSDGTNEIPITQFSGRYLTSPCWSPDGSNIFFQGFINGQSDIFSVDAKGGIPINLTTSEQDEHMPFIAEEGTVYFSTNDKGKWNIERLNYMENRREIVLEDGYAPKYANQSIYFVKKN